MAKTHRGRGTRELASSGRGKCPICGRTGIKLFYEVGEGDSKQVVCKTCNATIKNKKA